MMATYKPRGNSHSVIYPYKTSTGKSKQQWETYATELEATQRIVYIEYLQKNKDYDNLLKAVNEYKNKKAVEKAEKESSKSVDERELVSLVPNTTSNLHKTYREFALKWLPYHARRKRFKPRTYTAYEESLKVHILPYFGDRIFNEIKVKDMDNWLDLMSKKPCKGSRSYNKSPGEIPTLSSSSIKKHFNVFIAGLKTAYDWGYISKIPNFSTPEEKQKKRKAWCDDKVWDILSKIDDKVIHLAVHIGFVCSMRAGEVGGIAIKSINWYDRSFLIEQELERVDDEALAVLPKNEIIRLFPKELEKSKSCLALLLPKTDGSYRKQYLTTPLLKEIRERINEIENFKALYGSDYKDYGLLICKPDGRPIDPHSFCKSFKKWQTQLDIPEEEQIEYQGLRKSGQMHKVRLTQNNYQLVAEAAGQSPEVLMSNYNEIFDQEKRTLSMLVETSFYPSTATGASQTRENTEQILQVLQNNPDLSEQILQLIKSNAVSI